jgi:hypothetical protein
MAAVGLALSNAREDLYSNMDCGISSDDLCDLFVEPEHRHILRRAYELAGASPITVGAVRYGVHLRLRVSTFVIPTYMKQRLTVYSEDQELIDRFEHVVSTLAGQYQSSLRILACIHWLNKYLTDVRQFNILMPGLKSIIRADDDNIFRSSLFQHRPDFQRTKNLQRALHGDKPVRSVPSLPPEVRAACQEAGTFFMQMSILGDRYRSPPPVVSLSPQIKLSVDFMWQTYTTNDTNFSSLMVLYSK